MSRYKRSVVVGVSGAAAGSAVAGGAMVGAKMALAAPTANLGGYAIAQMAGSAFGIGGPALSTAIATIGGPVVVASAGVVVAGVVVGGISYGVYRCLK